MTAGSRGLKVLTGQGAAIDTTTASGKLVFGIFAGLAEFERELISERTITGLASARARGGRPYKMTPSKLLLAMASMGKPETKVSELCTELGITRQTIYRPVSRTGELARTEPTCYRGSWQPTATTNERRLGPPSATPPPYRSGTLYRDPGAHQSSSSNACAKVCNCSLGVAVKSQLGMGGSPFLLWNP